MELLIIAVINGSKLVQTHARKRCFNQGLLDRFKRDRLVWICGGVLFNLTSTGNFDSILFGRTSSSSSTTSSTAALLNRILV